MLKILQQVRILQFNHLPQLIYPLLLLAYPLPQHTVSESHLLLNHLLTLLLPQQLHHCMNPPSHRPPQHQLNLLLIYYLQHPHLLLIGYIVQRTLDQLHKIRQLLE